MTPEVIKFVLKDRLALILFAALAIVTVIVTILLFFWLRPSDIQIPIRFSGYDNSLYNDRWYARLGFVGFLWLQTAMSGVLALVMHARGYKVLAYFLLGLGVFVAIMVGVVASAVTRTVTL